MNKVLDQRFFFFFFFCEENIFESSYRGIQGLATEIFFIMANDGNMSLPVHVDDDDDHSSSSSSSSMPSSSSTSNIEPTKLVRARRPPQQLLQSAVPSNGKTLKELSVPVLRLSHHRDNVEVVSDDDADDERPYSLIFPVTETDIALFETLPESSSDGMPVEDQDRDSRTQEIKTAVTEGFAYMASTRIKRQCIRTALHSLLNRPDGIPPERLVQLATSLGAPNLLQSIDINQLIKSTASVLVTIPLEKVLTYTAFCLLRDDQRDALLNLLPDIDRTSPDAIMNLLTFEPIFENALQTFQDRLGSGDFSGRGQKPAKPPPAWKAALEAHWGSSTGRPPTDPDLCQICDKPNSACSCPTIFSFQSARRDNSLQSKAGQDFLTGSRFLDSS